MTRKETLLLRAEQYAHQNGVLLGDELGSGVHGIVLVAENQTKAGGREPRAAIKIHAHESDFLRERDIYLRLRQHAVKKIRDCHVPQLLRYVHPFPDISQGDHTRHALSREMSQGAHEARPPDDNVRFIGPSPIGSCIDSPLSLRAVAEGNKTLRSV